MIRRIAICSGLFSICLHFVGCATEAPVLESALTTDDSKPTTVQLDQAVHFSTPEGASAVVPAGSYEVKTVGAAALQLAPSGGAPLVIAAAPSAHAYRAGQTEPLAVVMPGDDEDTQYLLFVQTDGAGLEAVGSYSGIQTRAPGLLISPGQSQLYVQTKAMSSSLRSKSKDIVEVGQAPTLSAPVVITAGPNVTYFQECVGLSGYVSSIVTMRIVSLMQEDRPMVARGDAASPRIVLTANPGQLPPQAVPQD
ncbi:MAG: hypothetical protein E8D45_11910, partial [Nitrospira sp.]